MSTVADSLDAEWQCVFQGSPKHSQQLYNDNLTPPPPPCRSPPLVVPQGGVGDRLRSSHTWFPAAEVEGLEIKILREKRGIAVVFRVRRAGTGLCAWGVVAALPAVGWLYHG